MRTTAVGSMPFTPPRQSMMRSLWDGGDPFMSSLEQSVQLQLECGVDIISDGQTRRGMVELFTIPLRGIRQKARPEIIGEVEYPGPVTVPDVVRAKEMVAGYLAGKAGGAPEAGEGPEREGREPQVKGIVTGPFTLVRSCVNEHYSTVRDAAFALARALNQELRQLSTHTTHLQLDEPFYSVEMPEYAEDLVARTFDGVEGTRWLHVCGDVSPVAARLTELDVDVLDHEFAGHPELVKTFAELDFQQSLGFGSVRSDELRVESPEEVGALLRKGADIVGPERMYADPDCGLRHLTPDSARGKLRALVSAASGL